MVEKQKLLSWQVKNNPAVSHCLIGAAWIFIALGLTVKLAALLMFMLLFTSLGIWWTRNWNRKFELD